MDYRRRMDLERKAVGIVARVMLPIALPVLAIVAYVQRREYRDGRRSGPRYRTWYWRIWWWYGYNLGLYRLDWRLKRIRAEFNCWVEILRRLRKGVEQ